MISIIDYGMGNLRSVQKAFEHVGVPAQLIDQPEQIEAAEKLLLPGVGAFPDAIDTLRSRHLDEPILQYVRRGKPLLGICLGMQLLMETGYEGGAHAGLGIIGGSCVRLDADERFGLKVPHMGWNSLEIEAGCPLYRDIPSGAHVYFVHGYHVVPSDPMTIAARTTYGESFVCSMWQDNVYATQFHPEKSQKVGLQILANFAAI